jgi:hypothetical protein
VLPLLRLLGVQHRSIVPTHLAEPWPDLLGRLLMECSQFPLAPPGFSRPLSC